MKKLCKSHITQLSKVTVRLAYKLTMNCSQLILSSKNVKKLEKAEQFIYRAIKLLDEIK